MRLKTTPIIYFIFQYFTDGKINCTETYKYMQMEIIVRLYFGIFPPSPSLPTHTYCRFFLKI